MKLAVSSLAWAPADDVLVRETLTHAGVDAIELAPLKYWPVPAAADLREVARYRATWEDAGIHVVAMQGILFGQPSLQLFGDAAQRDAFANHLIAVSDIAQALGARVMVLGAPKNRLRGGLSFDEAVDEAVPTLRRIATAAAERDCAFAIEANPPLYGGDFACTLAEVMRVVDAVDHPAFGVHLDAGATAIVGEEDEQIVTAARRARHFHMSEIRLVPLGAGTVDHARLGTLLGAASYSGWRSIEMAPIERAALPSVLTTSMAIARAAYT